MMIKQFQNPERVECVRWSPGSCGRKAARTALLLWLGTAIAPAQDQNPQTPLSVRPAMEIHYKASAGEVFELQGSYDLSRWRDLGDVSFGEGEQVRQFVRAQNTTNAFRYYRVKISPSQPFGFAPMNLTGKQLSLNEDGQAQNVRLESRSTGTSDGEAITYSYRKLGDTLGRLTIDRSRSASDQIDLDFSADLVGRYTRKATREGVLRDIEVGTFALGSHFPPSTDPSATLPPESLMGRTFQFDSEASSERLDFVSSVGGRSIDRADVWHFGYHYATTGAVGTATVFYPGDVSVEFEMTFGAGGSCGTFLRREFADGVLEASDEGIFSCARSIYHTARARSTNVTLPADELGGRTYVMRDGGLPQELRFETHAAGRAVEGTSIEPFEFDYVVNCYATSTVKIRFGSGDFDEYHLNHTDETFVRHEVRGGECVDSDSGSFSESQ